MEKGWRGHAGDDDHGVDCLDGGQRGHETDRLCHREVLRSTMTKTHSIVLSGALLAVLLSPAGLRARQGTKELPTSTPGLGTCTFGDPADARLHSAGDPSAPATRYSTR